MEPRTFRTRAALRIAVALADLFWVAMLAAAAREGIGPGAIAAAAGFCAFFAFFSIVYARSSITVTRDGIVATSTLRRGPAIPFDEVLQVVVRDGLGGRVYQVLTRRGTVLFTSLFARHRELFELIVDRAALNESA